MTFSTIERRVGRLRLFWHGAVTVGRHCYLNRDLLLVLVISVVVVISVSVVDALEAVSPLG
jgi:hypothetical protein